MQTVDRSHNGDPILGLHELVPPFNVRPGVHIQANKMVCFVDAEQHNTDTQTQMISFFELLQELLDLLTLLTS